MLKRKDALKRFRFAVSMFFFMQGIVFSAWANRIPDIKVQLGLSDAGLGTVLFAIPLGQLCAMGLSAWLVNRYGSRRMTVIASMFYPLALVPLGFAATPFTLSAGLFFFGMGANLCGITSNTQGVGVENLYVRSILASFHGLWSMGGFLGGFVSMGLVALAVSPRVHFIIVAIVAVATMLAVRRMYVRFDLNPTEHRQKEPDTGRKNLFKRIDGFLVLLGVMAFLAMICEGCMYDWSGVYFMQVVHAPDNLVRLGFVVSLCTMATGRLVADRFIMRYGSTRVISASGTLIFLGMALSVACPTLSLATLGFLLVGFGISSTVPVCYSLAGHSTTMKAGNAVSLVTSIGFLGFLLGPPLIGHLSALITLRFTFGVIGCLGLGIAILSMRLRKCR